MNKEELLERLRELQTQLGASSIVEEQVKILDEHYEIKSGIEAEINQLLVKTSNDKNYTKTKDTASNVSRLERENSQVNVDLANLEAEIARVNYQQSNIDSEIEAAEYLIIAGRGEIDEINLALEKSLEEEQISRLNAQRVATEQAIASLELSIQRLNREKEVASSTLNSLEERRTTSEVQKTTYEALLEEAKENQLETYVDELERSKDREKLAELRKTLRSLSTKSELLSFDISGELSNIIAGVENDTLTPEQTRERVQELYNNIPMELFVGDYTNREDAIRENHEAQSLYVGKIAALEDKLSNDDNYRLSVFEIERDEVNAEKEKVRINALLAASVATITALEHELKNNQISLSIQDNYDKKKQREFRALGEDVDPKIDAKYSKVFEKCREKKNRLYEQQKSIKERLHEARINKNALEKELESLAVVDERSIMNTAAKKADEAKLEKYRANLEHLKKTEQLAAYDPQESLLAIIAGLEKEQEVVAPIVTPAVAPVVAPVVEETKEEEKEDDKVIIAPILARFKEAPEKLVEKSREKKSKLGAWFRKNKNRLIAACLATGIFFTIGLKACSNQGDDLPDEPAIEETQDEERKDFDDLVTSALEDNKGDEENKPEVTPEQEAQEPTQEPDEPEVQEPTPGPDEPGVQEPTPEPDKPGVQEPTPGPDEPEVQEPTPGPDEPEVQEPTPEPDEPEVQEPTQEATTTEIVVNEGETLVFEDGDQTIKVDLSEGQNDNVLPKEKMAGAEESKKLTDLEYNYGENGENMSATATLETETNEMTDEQFFAWLQSQRGTLGFDNEVHEEVLGEELLGRHR